MSKDRIITIIGAGVAGLVTASELTARGHKVRILDRASGQGHDQCSWYAGGMLAPWAERENAEEAVIRLGKHSLEWWPKHIGNENVTMNGSLVVAPSRDQRELDRFSRRTENFHWVDGDKIAELEPDLAGRFERGLFFADEGHLSPREALKTLHKKLVEQGVDIQFEHEANGELDEEFVIDTRGLAARDELDDLRGVKGEMLYLKTDDITLSRSVRLIHPRIPLYIVPRGKGIFMVGATMIESEERGRMTARSMMELLNAAYTLHPAFGEAEIIETGADVRPAFANNLPRIRWRKENDTDRLYLNGLYRHGYLFAPVVARMAADMIEDPQFKPEFCDEDHR